MLCKGAGGRNISEHALFLFSHLSPVPSQASQGLTQFAVFAPAPRLRLAKRHSLIPIRPSLLFLSYINFDPPPPFLFFFFPFSFL